MNVDDAREVDNQLKSIFDAWDTSHANWVDETRKLFLLMDFEYEDGLIDLSLSPAGVRLPREANHIAHGDGIEILCINLPKTDDPEKQWMNHRVNKREADAAFKLIQSQISADVLIAFMNPEGSELNIIYPTYQGRRVVLRRMRAGRDSPNRTAAQQISSIWRWRRDPSISTHEALMKAFDVEPVTAEFFAKYKELFDGILNLITGFPTTQTGETQKHIFTQTLFNRLLFIYFISRKRWMLYEGEHDYLNALWKAHRSDPTSSESFYRSRLKVLFNKGLNNSKAADLKADDPAVWKSIGDVPFLNGGLFEDKDIPANIDVPDSAIENILTELFDRFNFTVTESTPFDIEVAVDPEMLGKVFEELVTGRSESGSFYTPRNVVSFMCREGLKGYLRSSDISLDDKDIERFVDERDISSIPKSEAAPVMAALRNVTVLDPACGSGAYLLGMMQELLDLQSMLVSGDLLDEPEDLHKFKMDIIQRNVYGADLDEFAVNTAMLRLWLSLTIEFEGDIPPPLPNLEFKIAQGNSLTGPVPSDNLWSLLTADIVSELEILKGLYIEATSKDKSDVRFEIDSKLKELAIAVQDDPAPIDSVDWRVTFGEVLASGGFDIVVANPPYVRQEEIQDKKRLQNLFSDAATSRSDLYCYFYARGLQLLKQGGMHVFVCSNSWLDVGYGGRLQEFLLNNASIEAIYESAVERQFSTAAINTIVSVIKKSQGSSVSESGVSNVNTRFIQLQGPFDEALEDNSKRRERIFTRNKLREAGLGEPNIRGVRKYEGDKWGGKYLRSPDIYWQLLSNCGSNLYSFDTFVNKSYGIKPGSVKFFYINDEIQARFKIEEEFLVPLINSSQNIKKYGFKSNSNLFWCQKGENELRGSGALTYIKYGEAKGFHKITSVRGHRPHWYSLNGEPVDFLLLQFWDQRFWTPLPTELVYCSNNFFYGKAERDKEATMLLLNSSLYFLQLNVVGRVNQGEGVLATYGPDYDHILLPDPYSLRKFAGNRIEEIINSIKDKDVLAVRESISTDYQEYIDEIVFGALNTETSLAKLVREGLAEMVKNRIQRASSV